MSKKNQKKHLDSLKVLGDPDASPSRLLEVFPNPNPERDYVIDLDIPEFTCLCPKTGQPDFATLTLQYIPDNFCVELKSLKLYIWSFRNEGHFHEAVTNQIANDLIQQLNPRYLKLVSAFNVRGGIGTKIVVEHHQKDWKPTPPSLPYHPYRLEKR